MDALKNPVSKHLIEYENTTLANVRISLKYANFWTPSTYFYCLQLVRSTLKVIIWLMPGGGPAPARTKSPTTGWPRQLLINSY